MSATIVAEQLGKRYRLGESAHAYVTLRETLARRMRRGEPDEVNEIWALRDVDLEIATGEVVGIIGRNGAGKTTFLKTVARIVQPNEGVVRVRGRVGALLEVGTGFHPELTGRENVYLNGVILGMSRREVRRRFDEIVAFSGVERFLDTPLKRYSSGMYLRLAFSIAAHVDPDVLLVDEVLAVGDAEFRQKCLGRMSDLRDEGRTVLFVSHDSGVVAQLCERVVWLDAGSVKADGPAAQTLDLYQRATVTRRLQVDVPVRHGSPVRGVSIALLDQAGKPTESLRRDEELRFSVGLETLERIPGLDVSVYVSDRRGTRVLSENVSDSGRYLEGPPRPYDVHLTIPPTLPPGEYIAGVWLGNDHQTFLYRELVEFTVVPMPEDRNESVQRTRVVQPIVSWDVRIGEQAPS